MGLRLVAPFARTAPSPNPGTVHRTQVCLGGAGSGSEAPQPPLSVAMLANNNENEITNTVLKSANHIDSPPNCGNAPQVSVRTPLPVLSAD